MEKPAGEKQAVEQANGFLKTLRGPDDNFVNAIESLLAGERDEDTLLESLNPNPAAITGAVLARLRGENPYPQSTPEPEDEGTDQPGVSQQQAQIALAAALPAIHPAARPQVEPILNQLTQAGFTALAAVLPRIWNGERDPAALCADLDENDTATVHIALHLIEHPEELAKMMGSG